MKTDRMKRSDAVVKNALSTESVREVEAVTGIRKNRVHQLRHAPWLATLRELRVLANCGYIRLTVGEKVR